MATNHRTRREPTCSLPRFTPESRAISLHYAEPPASFEDRGQKIRRPSTIVEERLATCLDTTLLFAGALEGSGLHPVILMFDGHAAVGVWLTKRTFANAIETDPMEIRKALASRELIAFETTGVTHRPVMTLEQAQQVIKHRLGEEEERTFVAAIDVNRSRSGGINPLASHEPIRRNVLDAEAAHISNLPLPPAPNFSEMPVEAVEVKPTTATGRIERWQQKLLDLTLRNRLLNFPDSRKAIPFLCTDVAYLEDRLASGAAIRITSLLEQNPLGERDAALFRDVHGRDLQRSFASEALKRDELPSTLEARSLEARLIELHRQVRNDLAEGGANTLFLAVGFLRWKKKADDERSYRAPLLLVPVKIERRSASSRFTMRFHEDEPRFNATPFAVPGTRFFTEASSIRAGTSRRRQRRRCSTPARNDAPGGSRCAGHGGPGRNGIVDLLLREVPDVEGSGRSEPQRFAQNRVVRHLIDTPDRPFRRSAEGQRSETERDLDRVYSPADIICLLPSDSSQTAASLAAAEGQDFVIVGPPGTGKSQTIANMIANCLAVGKTVLFVAEKDAALDVVYRRLREHGLGNHCIELHSNKADRRQFLGQLKASWEHGSPCRCVRMGREKRAPSDTSRRAECLC